SCVSCSLGYSSLPLMMPHPPPSPLFPYTTLFRSVYLSGYLVFNVMNDPQSAERTVRVVPEARLSALVPGADATSALFISVFVARSEEHTSELQSRENLVCRLLLEKKKTTTGPSAR